MTRHRGHFLGHDGEENEVDSFHSATRETAVRVKTFPTPSTGKGLRSRAIEGDITKSGVDKRVS